VVGSSLGVRLGITMSCRTHVGWRSYAFSGPISVDSSLMCAK
jgi:hypothetical protein